MDTLTPAQIDTELARLWKTAETARRRARQYRHYAASSRQGARMVECHLADASEQDAIAASTQAEAQPYQDEYTRRGGWNRYFLVTNANGHVHRGMNCSTCFDTTEYAWLVDLADCDEAAMVAEYGEMACTVCFPAAPAMKGFSDGTSTYARRTQAEKDARAAEKAEKAAARAAKALLAPVRIAHDTVRTVASAQQALRTIAQNVVFYDRPRDDEDNADRDALRAALEAKGFSPADLDTLEVKATKKAQKDYEASKARFASFVA